MTVEQDSVHFITIFRQNACENDKKIFQPIQPPFLSVRALCRTTGRKQTVPCLLRMDHHVWGAMLEKYHKLQPQS